MIKKDEVGKRLSILRKKKGMSQDELAEKLNVTSQAVSKWECGQALPGLELLLELSWLYDISINCLIEENSEVTEKRASKEVMLPYEIESLVKDKKQRKLVSSISEYFSQAELEDIVKDISNENLKFLVSIEAENKKEEYKKTAKIPLELLSESSLKEIAPVICETVYEFVGNVDRGLKRIEDILICPLCRSKLVIENDGKKVVCENGHKYEIDEGVLYFNTREIPGEQWSLTYRNYNHYLVEATWPELPVYTRGDVFSEEIKWKEIEKRRPRIILDMASGTGSGIKYLLKRINWNCTVILTDLSHRILAWDRRFITENINNPFVDVVYMACDCSNIPILDNSIDCITSRGGFESMQHKTMEGFSEAFRILKSGGNAIYGMSLIDNYNSDNTKKWISLLETCIDNKDKSIFDKMIDISEWENKCNMIGYNRTTSIKIYGELVAPDTEVFPYENMILRWMGEYICVSTK